VLPSISGVSGLMTRGFEAAFQFSGPEESLALVLKELVTAGVSVLSFGEVKQTVEDLYLKLSRNEVM